MGVISTVLLFPVVGPVWGVRLLAERMCQEAQAEMHDEARGFADLIELSMRRNAGTISDAEFAARQSELLERVSAMRDDREQLDTGEREWEDAIDDAAGEVES